MGEQRAESGSSLSTSLLLRVVALEATAWERVVRLFGPTLYSRCRRRGLRAEEADDVVQEVFLAAARGVAHFRRNGSGRSFRAWLWGIARNKLKDHWHAKGKDPVAQGGTDHQLGLAEVPAPEGRADADEAPAIEQGSLARRALDLIRQDFQERTWKAFWRFEVDGLPAAAVATELGITPNAVHVAVCRVRKRLREEFSNMLEPGEAGDESNNLSGP
jgi:RNA polymerase sigma-70 factor (ECF subfamily)